MRPECYFGIEAEVFSEAGDLTWDIEKFLLACWLALQDDVWEVEYRAIIRREGWRKNFCNF